MPSWVIDNTTREVMSDPPALLPASTTATAQHQFSEEGMEVDEVDGVVEGREGGEVEVVSRRRIVLSPDSPAPTPPTEQSAQSIPNPPSTSTSPASAPARSTLASAAAITEQELERGAQLFFEGLRSAYPDGVQPLVASSAPSASSALGQTLRAPSSQPTIGGSPGATTSNPNGQGSFQNGLGIVANPQRVALNITGRPPFSDSSSSGTSSGPFNALAGACSASIGPVTTTGSGPGQAAPNNPPDSSHVAANGQRVANNQLSSNGSQPMPSQESRLSPPAANHTDPSERLPDPTIAPTSPSSTQAIGAHPSTQQAPQAQRPLESPPTYANSSTGTPLTSSALATLNQALTPAQEEILAAANKQTNLYQFLLRASKPAAESILQNARLSPQERSLLMKWNDLRMRTGLQRLGGEVLELQAMLSKKFANQTVRSFIVANGSTNPAGPSSEHRVTASERLTTSTAPAPAGPSHQHSPLQPPQSASLPSGSGFRPATPPTAMTSPTRPASVPASTRLPDISSRFLNQMSDFAQAYWNRNSEAWHKVINEYTAIIGECDERNASLELEVVKLHQRLAANNQPRPEHEQELVGLRQEVGNLQRSVIRLTTSETEARKLASDVQAKLDQTERHRTNTATSAAATISELEKEKSRMQAEITRLHTAVRSVASLEVENQKLKSLETEVAKLRSERSTLEEKWNVHWGNHYQALYQAKAKQEAESPDSEFEKLKEQKRKMTEKMAAIEADKARELEMKEQALSDLRSELEKAVADHKRRAERSAAALQSAQTTISDSMGQSHKAHEQAVIAGLGEIKLLVDSIKRLASMTISDQDTALPLKDRFANLQVSVKEVLNHYQQLDRSLPSGISSSNDLRTRIDDLKQLASTHAAEIESVSHRCASLELELNESRNKLRTAELAIADRTKQFEKSSAEVASLRASLATYAASNNHEHLVASEKMLAKKSNECLDKKKQVAGLEEELAKVRKALEEKTAELESAVKESSSILDKVEKNAKAQHRELQEQIEDLQRELDAAIKKSEEAGKNMEARTEEIKVLQERLDDAQTAKDVSPSADAELRALEVELEAAHLETINLRDEKEVIEAKIAELDEQLAGATHQRLESMQELMNERNKVQELSRKVTELEGSEEIARPRNTPTSRFSEAGPSTNAKPNSRSPSRPSPAKNGHPSPTPASLATGHKRRAAEPLFIDDVEDEPIISSVKRNRIDSPAPAEEPAAPKWTMPMSIPWMEVQIRRLCQQKSGSYICKMCYIENRKKAAQHDQPFDREMSRYPPCPGVHDESKMIEHLSQHHQATMRNLRLKLISEKKDVDLNDGWKP